MKERPILFQADMVRAVLDGRKTQTRRIIKPQPVHPPTYAGNYRWVWDYGEKASPYGQPGDKLWVRESHVFLADEFQIHAGVAYRDSVSVQWLKDTSVMDGKIVHNVENPGCWKWRPSIHMPRWASRIDLLNRNVRVERVQDISERDCVLEGCATQTKLPDEKEYSFRGGFRNLWNRINATLKPVRSGGQIVRYESYPWSEADRDQRTEIGGLPHVCVPNPWVWVIDFEHVG
jgi:hypothetical protein